MSAQSGFLPCASLIFTLVCCAIIFARHLLHPSKNLVAYPRGQCNMHPCNTTISQVFHICQYMLHPSGASFLVTHCKHYSYMTCFVHAADNIQSVWQLRCHKAWQKQFDRQQHGAWCDHSARHAKVAYYSNIVASWRLYKLPVELLEQLKACFYKVCTQQLEPVCCMQQDNNFLSVWMYWGCMET